MTILVGTGAAAVGVVGGAVWWTVQSPGRHTAVQTPRPSVTSQAQAPAVQTPSAQPTPTPSPTHTPTPTPHPSARRTVEQQVVALVNAQRAQHGCGPLRIDPALHTAAQRQSDDMATRHFFSHTNPDGADPGTRITAAGYRWSSWGENIAEGQSGPGSVMSSWMASQGHRANILNCGFQDIGVGVAYGPGGPWWTQDFASPG